jgi:hypothetical protein
LSPVVGAARITVASQTPAALFTVTLAAGVIVGASLSVTVTVNPFMSSPQALVALAYTVVFPTLNVYGFEIEGDPVLLKLNVVVGIGEPVTVRLFPKLIDAPHVPDALLAVTFVAVTVGAWQVVYVPVIVVLPFEGVNGLILVEETNR